MRLSHLVLGMLASSVLTISAARAEYPDHAIRLVVPYAPGGSTDVAARVFSDKLGLIAIHPATRIAE